MSQATESPIATSAPDSADLSTEVDVTVVMPCLNEAETLATCIEKAFRGIAACGLSGEVVVADNGSTDGSQEIAERLGARVVPVAARGYGNALHNGIMAARGRYIVMGDSDDSYDFEAIEPLVSRLRDGSELAMGNRFRGRIMPGAMPWKHKWIGNPVLSWIGRLFFRCPVGDFHCGLRGFAKEAYTRLQLQTTGMEYASEMVIKATLLKLKIAEVPITLHKDGRSRPPHLRSWRDGWRHLRFMLLFSPRWLFLYPGVLLFLVGLIATARLWAGPVQIGPISFDIASMIVAAFICVHGHQLIVFAFFTKVFVISSGLHAKNTNLDRKIFRLLRLEIGVGVGLLLSLIGTGMLVAAALGWQATGFGPQDPELVVRRVIPAVLIATLGLQTAFASFFLGVLSLGRRSRVTADVA